MRTIINYIRSCFCKHEWELIFDVKLDRGDIMRGRMIDEYFEKTYRCKKCGYSKKYKSN